jgi:hypothetical protein
MGIHQFLEVGMLSSRRLEFHSTSMSAYPCPQVRCTWFRAVHLVSCGQCPGWGMHLNYPKPIKPPTPALPTGALLTPAGALHVVSCCTWYHAACAPHGGCTRRHKKAGRWTRSRLESVRLAYASLPSSSPGSKPHPRHPTPRRLSYHLVRHLGKGVQHRIAGLPGVW